MSLLKRRGVGGRWARIAMIAVVALGMSVGLALGAINPKGGSYSGNTNQGERVSFKVKRGYVSNAQFTLNSGICSGTFYIYDRDKVSSNGTFSITTSTNTLRGRFVTNRKVKGTVRATFSSCPGGTKTVGFTARRR